MTAQIAAAEELIEYLADIIKARGDIPVGAVNSFQTCDYARWQDDKTTATLIY